MRTIPIWFAFFAALISAPAYANALTTGLWSTHTQSATLRADLLLTNQGHFIWATSPVAPRKLVVVVLDGYRANSVLLSDSPGVVYRDPEDMAREYMRDMFISSHGHVRYDAIEVIVSSNVPTRKLGAAEGSVYTNFTIDAYYDRCVDNPTHGPLTVDNDGSTMDATCITSMLHRLAMRSGISLFTAATNAAVHEILYFGPHKAYQWEASMCGARPLSINGATATIPNSPHFVILACNTGRGIAEMIHNNFHRWENVAPNMYANAKSVGWKYEWSYKWDTTTPAPYTELQRQTLFTDKYNAWEQFSALYLALHTNINSVGQTLAGIGDCHYPVNVQAKVDGAYIYNSPRAAYSTYRYWRQPRLVLNYNRAPDPRNGSTTNVSYLTWRNEVKWSPASTDDQRSFINWAYCAMPHGPGQHKNITAQEVPGETPNYVHNNWWGYFSDHDYFLEPIRAVRRAGQMVNSFAEAAWTNSTLIPMTNLWGELGLPRTAHDVQVAASGSGVIGGTGVFFWGSSTLLTASPPAYMWIHNTATNFCTDWFPLLVTNASLVQVVFQPYPENAITNPASTSITMPTAVETYALAGVNANALAAWWTNLTTGAHGPLALGGWSTTVALVKGKNVIVVYATNQWFSTSAGVEITRQSPLYVAKWGNDANGGRSWANAKLTVNSALTAAIAGDMIYVGTGTYSGAGNQNLSWSGRNGVALIGDSPVSTVFVVSGGNNFINGLEGKTTPTLFASFKVDGSAKSDGLDGGASLLYAGDSTALNLIFSNLWLKGRYDGNQSTGSAGTAGQANGSGIELNWYGTSAAYAGEVTVTHCLLERLGRAFYADDDSGSSCYTVRFTRCTFVNNADTRMSPAGDMSTIWLRGNNTGRWLMMDRCVMSHCAGDNTTSAKSGMYCQPSAARVIHNDNLLYSSSIGVGENNVYGSDISKHSGYAGNSVTVDPAYVTYDGRDYSLQVLAGQAKRGWSIAEDTTPPTIADTALLYPAAFSLVEQGMPTNVQWNPALINDDHDGSNCWVVQFDVLYSNTLAIAQVIAAPVSNTVGQHPWVPAALGHTYPDEMFVLRIVAQDSAGNSASNIMWNNRFYIMPEPGVALLAALLSLMLPRCRTFRAPMRRRARSAGATE